MSTPTSEVIAQWQHEAIDKIVAEQHGVWSVVRVEGTTVAEFQACGAIMTRKMAASAARMLCQELRNQYVTLAEGTKFPSITNLW